MMVWGPAAPHNGKNAVFSPPYSRNSGVISSHHYGNFPPLHLVLWNLRGLETPLNSSDFHSAPPFPPGLQEIPGNRSFSMENILLSQRFSPDYSGGLGLSFPVVSRNCLSRRVAELLRQDGERDSLLTHFNGYLSTPRSGNNDTCASLYWIFALWTFHTRKIGPPRVQL